MQKEAKLGAEENTFFYDEERKMWRERGAEIPAAAAPLPPPPSARPPSTHVPSAGVGAHPEPMYAHQALCGLQDHESMADA